MADATTLCYNNAPIIVTCMPQVGIRPMLNIAIYVVAVPNATT